MAQKRYITILPDIMVMTLDGTKPVSIKEGDTKGVPTEHRIFILARSSDASFGVDGISGISSSAVIRMKLQDVKLGDIIELDEDDWERLAKSTRMPSQMGNDGKLIQTGYDPLVGPQLLPFARAILNAPSEDPRKVAAVTASKAEADAKTAAGETP